MERGAVSMVEMTNSNPNQLLYSASLLKVWYFEVLVPVEVPDTDDWMNDRHGWWLGVLTSPDHE
jgi:hypothetical protein